MGGTDYYATPMKVAFGRTPAITFMTDRPGGFSDADIEKFDRLLDYMAPIVESRIGNRLSTTLLETYLGRIVGEQILDGLIKRGDGREINAVLWFSDLRDFTGLNERLPASRRARALEQLPAAGGRCADGQWRRDPEIHRRWRDGLFPGRRCALPALCHQQRHRRGAPPDERHRGGQRGARRGRPRSGALRHRPACRAGDLRQCRHRGPARLHRHRPRRQSRCAAGEPHQGARRSGARPRRSSTPLPRCR